MTRQERRKRRRQRRRRMQAGILLSLVLVLGLIIALRAGKEREMLEQEIPLAAETWYAIQTGVFSNEDAAREKAELLTDRGAPGAVVEDGEKWRVFIACYGTETDAASVRQRLGENQRIET